MIPPRSIARTCPHCGYGIGELAICPECGAAESAESAYRLRRTGRQHVTFALWGNILAVPVTLLVGLMMVQHSYTLALPPAVLGSWAVGGIIYIRRERRTLALTRKRRTLLVATAPAILLTIALALAFGLSAFSPESRRW